jgi:NAD+ diphosphatase
MYTPNKTFRSLRYCPACGGPNFKSDNQRPWTCPDCGLAFFQNTAAAAGALVLDRDNRLLMVLRAKEPSAGKWGLPGGFVDAGERAESALVRECREEAGLEISDPRFLASFPNTYHYKGIDYATLDLFFTATARNPDQLRALDEVIRIDWLPLDRILREEVAFPSCYDAIEALRSQLRQGRPA